MDGEQPLEGADEFARRFRQEILPLLQEYCYDDYGVLAEYLGSQIVDAKAQALRADVVDDAEALVAALESEFGQAGDLQG